MGEIRELPQSQVAGIVDLLLGPIVRELLRHFFLAPPLRVPSTSRGLSRGHPPRCHLVRAQELYPVAIHFAVMLSSHWHLILTPEDREQLADFMEYVNVNVAREACRLVVRLVSPRNDRLPGLAGVDPGSILPRRNVNHGPGLKCQPSARSLTPAVTWRPALSTALWTTVSTRRPTPSPQPPVSGSARR